MNSETQADIPNLGTLEELKEQLNENGGTAAPETEQPGQQEDESEAFVESILSACDGFCISKGLTPINPAQKLLLRIGMIGTVKKYNLNFDNYPEITLAGGVIWVVSDKMSELKDLKEQHNKSTKESEVKE
ncbi:MAG: hypothetical protein HY808_03105 [Nitrospirae bacterium]|nr:hypothetical protein [Nitrospirota bacterium]